MAPICKVALIQLYPKPLDAEHNFAKASSFITAAAAKGAHLAVLPEYHLLNWLPDDPRYADLCRNWRTYLERYQALARELKICIVPGTIIERHTRRPQNEIPAANAAGYEDNEGNENATNSEPKRQKLDTTDDQEEEATDLALAEEEGHPLLYNSAYFISPTGAILHRYQKKNLWHPERPHLTSSLHAPHTAFDTPLGFRVGMLICWDLAFPEAFRELIADGAKMIVIPTFWGLSDVTEYGRRRNGLSEKVFLDSTTVSRAFENTAAIVFVNVGQKPRDGEGADAEDDGGDGGFEYTGLSRVAVPFIGAMGDETKDSAGEGMSLVDVDMKDVEEGEENYKVRMDMDSDGWYYTYRHQSFGD